MNNPEPTPASLGPPSLEQGPIVTLENGPPFPSKPTSFSNGVPALAGDPYLVTLPAPKASDPVATLPDSKPKTTPAPPLPADGISFTNAPGLPAGHPYVVTLPGSKSQATGAPNNQANPPPPDGISFTNTVGAPPGDPNMVNLPGPKAIPPQADEGTTFLNGLLLPKGDPYIVTLPRADSLKQNGGSRLEGPPVPKLAGPPQTEQTGVFPGLETNLASSPKTEGGVLIPPVNPVIDFPPTNPDEGKFEPYNPNATPTKPEAEVVEAPEAAGIFDSNTWGPIAWEPVPGKPKSVGAAPTIVAPQPVSGPKDSVFPGLQEPAVPAPGVPSTNIAPQPITGSTNLPALNSPKDSVFPGLPEPAPVIPSTNIAPQPITGPTTVPVAEPPKPQDALPDTTIPAPPIPAQPKDAPSAPQPMPPPAQPKPQPLAAKPVPAQPSLASTKPFGVASLYAQCGGRGYTGATTCTAGSKCKVQNEWYYQCVADSSSSSSSSSPPPSQGPSAAQQQGANQKGSEKGRPDPQEIYNFGIPAPAPVQPPAPPTSSSPKGGERGRPDPQEVYNYKAKNKPFSPAAVDEDEF